MNTTPSASPAAVKAYSVLNSIRFAAGSESTAEYPPWTIGVR